MENYILKDSQQKKKGISQCSKAARCFRFQLLPLGYVWVGAFLFNTIQFLTKCNALDLILDQS